MSVLQGDDPGLRGVALGPLSAALRLQPIPDLGYEFLDGVGPQLLNGGDEALSHVPPLDVGLDPPSQEPEALRNEGGIDSTEHHVAVLNLGEIGLVEGPFFCSAALLEGRVEGFQDLSLTLAGEGLEVGNQLVGLLDDGLAAASSHGEGEDFAALLG